MQILAACLRKKAERYQFYQGTETQVLDRYHNTSYRPAHDVIASRQSIPGARGGQQCLRIIRNQ